MNLIKGTIRTLLLTAVVLVCVTSCDDDFNTIGTNLVAGSGFKASDTLINSVYLTNTALGPVRSNALPVYQLGAYDDGIYGRREATIAAQLRLSGSGNPTFGILSQATENANAVDGNENTIVENETLTKVYLDIPFFSTVDSVQNGDSSYTLDSIFGNSAVPFRLKVEELTYYLRNLDPTTNFQQIQSYYTSTKPATDAGVSNPTPEFSMHTDAVLFEDDYTIDPVEIRITSTDDEGVESVERFSPRIRVPLDSLFFQSKIINMEGSDKLSNNNTFINYIRGVLISHTSLSDDLLMLLNLNSASIRIEYDYDTVNEVETASSGSLVVDKASSVYNISLSGNIINTFNNEAYSAEVTSALDNTEAPSRLYLKGGEGIMTEVKLFDEANQSFGIDQLRNENWLINEANLTFYVDETAMQGKTIPSRIYLYDLDNNAGIFDYFLDPSQTSIASENLQSRNVYGGILEDTDDGLRYKIGITHHLSNLIRKDSTNVRLGLSVTSDINNIFISGALNSTDLSTPQSAVINPFGVVLYGNGTDVPEPKKVKLQVYYTKLD